MIAKGNFHKHGVKLAAYLVKAHPGERGELIDMRGFGPVSDLRDGFRIEHIRARDGTRADQPFFHVHLRGAEGEGLKLSREDWLAIADRVDKALGRHLDEQPRATSLHIDRQTGDMHLHLGYSLVRETDDGRLYVQKLGLYKNRLKEMSREIERDYGLKIVSNERKPHDLARAAGRDEFEEARRLGTDLKAIRGAILDSFQRSDSGKAFQAALEERGLQLANGDRRDCFVVIDGAGGQHALNKKLTGATLAETRARLSDLDRAQLPGVEQAKELQAARAAQREQERGKHGRGADGGGQGVSASGGPENAAAPPIKPLGKTAGEIRLAWQLTKTADQFAQAIEDRGLILVHVSREEAEASQRAHAFAKAIGRQSRALKEGFGVVDSRGNVTRIDQRTTGDQWEEIQKRLAGIDRAQLLSVADAREAMREANRIEWREQKQAEREAARPATALETKINELHREAADGQKLAEALDNTGMTIARATAADVKALDALRLEQEVTGIVAEANGIEQDKPRHLARLEEGDLAAITHAGDVYRLTSSHLEHGVEARLAEPGPAASVTEARAVFETEREAAAAFQQDMIDAQVQRGDDRTAARVARSEAVDAQHEQDAAVNSVVHEAHELGEAAEQASGKAGNFLGRLGDAILDVFNFIEIAPAPPPPPTPEQQKLNAAAVEEKERKAEEAAQRARDEEDLRMRLEQQVKDELARRERERGDDHYRGRERERDR